MAEKWFQMKEQGAGTKRLMLTWQIYKIFGEFPIRIIAFFVVLTVFLTASKQRRASEKFYKVMKKPPLLSSFKLFLNYGNALVDKFLSFSGNLNPRKLVIDKKDIYKGAFFITTHIGNAEILRTLLQADISGKPERVNVFLQSNACEIYNSFLKTLEVKSNVETFPVEEINAETSILISDRLKSGEIVFMAGDRISAQNSNKVYETDFLGKKIKLPLGTLKFALLMDVPVYFIICAKEGKYYKVYTEQFISKSEKRTEKLKELQQAYSKFLEDYTLKYPYQSYNFYDIFEN